MIDNYTRKKIKTSDYITIEKLINENTKEIKLLHFSNEENKEKYINENNLLNSFHSNLYFERSGYTIYAENENVYFYCRAEALAYSFHQCHDTRKWGGHFTRVFNFGEVSYYLSNEGIENELRNNKIALCPKCKKYHVISDMSKIYRSNNENDFYMACYGCVHDNVMTCNHCHRVYEKSYLSSHGIRDYRGYIFCENCSHDMEFTRCHECGQLCENHSILTENGENYCPTCYRENFGEYLQNGVMSYHHYMNWSPMILENENADTTPCFGFELEVNNLREEISNNQMVEKIKQIMKEENIPIKTLVFENDSTTGNGFEIISQPLSINFILKNAHFFQSVLNALSSNGYVSHDTGSSISCGLHVHMTRKFFNNEAISNLLFLFTQNKDSITKFSRRKIEFLNRWASFYDFDNSTLEYIKEYVDSNDRYDYSRYKCINLKNEKTIEIRVFRGTLNFESFMSCLEFCNNLLLISTKENSDFIIQNHTFKDIIDYNKTEFLHNYVLERGLI